MRFFVPAFRVIVFLLVLVPAPVVSAPAGGLSSVETVFIILLENVNWASITPDNAPYIRNTLVPLGAHAEQYFNPPGLHPSKLNYIWLEAGGTVGLTSAPEPSPSNSSSSVDHLVRYLDGAGVSWRAYQEDIGGTDCPLTSSGGYTARHNPFVFFQDVTNNNDPLSPYCIAHIRPYSELAADLANDTVARYNFITPNLCHDMHDCGIAAGDTWLSQQVPLILASYAYKDNGAIFITWDEGAGGLDGPIGMIVLSPLAKTSYSNAIHYTHSSTLRTMQGIFGVGPFLRDAANATDLSDLFAAATFTDDPLVAGSSLIGAVHIAELRTRVDSLRARYGLSTYEWTAQPPAGMTMLAVHVRELRIALQQAYGAARRLVPTFSDSSIVPGSTLVRAAHIRELRNAVVALEAS